MTAPARAQQSDRRSASAAVSDAESRPRCAMAVRLRRGAESDAWLQALSVGWSARDSELAVLVVCDAIDEAAVARRLPGVRVLTLPADTTETAWRRAVAQTSDADVLRFPRRPADAVSLLRGMLPARHVSIIVPARNASASLARTLPALAALADDGVDLTVVDDASNDDGPGVAAANADAVVRLRSQARGPAYARNRGVELSSGELILFVDADVVVPRATYEALLETLRSRTELSAVFGSLDDGPADASFVSRYRNLLSHELHECLAGEVGLFWAACGAIRRSAFCDVGGFDEWRFTSAEVESVELGARLSRSGHRILLRADLQATHLRRYSLWSLIIGDLRELIVPLYRAAHDGGLPRVDFPVRIEKRASLLFVSGVACWGPVLLDAPGRPFWLAAAIGLPLVAIGLRRRLYGFFAREAGIGFAIASIPLHQMHAAATAMSALVGKILASLLGEPRPDALTEAFAEVGVRRWPPLPRRPAPPRP